MIAISGDAYLVARGAGGFNHRWNLDIPLSQAGVDVGQFICNVSVTSSSPEIGNSDASPSTDALACVILSRPGSTGQVLRVVGFRDTLAMLPPMNTLAADNPSLESVPHMSFSIALSAPIPVAAVGQARPWIEIGHTQRAMSGLPLSTTCSQGLSNSPGGHFRVDLDARDAQNKPYAMQIPADWQVPIEGTDIGQAYPTFVEDLLTSGNSSANGYQAPDSNKVVRWRVRDVAQ